MLMTRNDSAARPGRAAARAGLLALVLAGAASLAQAQHGAHIHGQVQLAVALDGPVLTLQLEAPLDSVLGFEHRPRNAAQRQAVAQLQASLAAADPLFRPDAAAQCSPGKMQVESALFEPETGAAGKNGQGGKVAAPPADEHMDLEASVEFRCARPELLKTLQLGLFERFGRMQRIDVQVAAGKGQRKLTLRRPQSLITLQP